MDRIFFFFICACWINALIARESAVSRRDTLLLRLAMTATLAADFSMLVLYNNALGLVFFLLTQFLHNYRYAGRKALIAQIAACCAVGLAGAAAVCSGLLRADAETVLAAAYLAAFLFSLAGVFRLFCAKKRNLYPKINRRLIALGMSLFFLCDINVGLYNLTAGMTGNRAFQVMIWAFYLPAQAMISGSGRKYGKDHKDL